MLKQLNSAIEIGRTQLQQASVLFLTFGTSYYYSLKSTRLPVSNCHKMPAELFEKNIPVIGEQFDHLMHALNQLYRQNPKLQIILTVSPVRHVKDGLIENNRSKARLILLCERLTKTFANCHYFPAYEMLMDDLRDYRFYERDLLHPNEVARDYIRDQFAATFFDEETSRLNQRLAKLQANLRHKPFQPESTTYKDFTARVAAEVHALEKLLPGRFSSEKASLSTN